jgi:hypothetical protein
VCDERLVRKAGECLAPKGVQRPSAHMFVSNERVSTCEREPGETPSRRSFQQAHTPQAETAFNDERECVEDYALVGRDLGGGSGTLSMVMSGGLSSGTGTEPMAKRTVVGRLGVRYALTVHAA